MGRRDWLAASSSIFSYPTFALAFETRDLVGIVVMEPSNLQIVSIPAKVISKAPLEISKICLKRSINLKSSKRTLKGLTPAFLLIKQVSESLS
jgi:hypothetical protein